MTDSVCLSFNPQKKAKTDALVMVNSLNYTLAVFYFPVLKKKQQQKRKTHD